MKRITVNYVMSLNPCYDREYIENLFGGKRWMSPLTVLKMDNVSHPDKMWLVCRSDFLDDRCWRLFACDCAERVLPIFEKEHPTDKRPRKAIETARLYALGKATRKELDAARAAAWAAARAATRDAAGAAAWAARAASWDAAGDAAGDAAWAAKQEWQLKRLEYYLRGEQ